MHAFPISPRFGPQHAHEKNSPDAEAAIRQRRARFHRVIRSSIAIPPACVPLMKYTRRQKSGRERSLRHHTRTPVYKTIRIEATFKASGSFSSGWRRINGDGGAYDKKLTDLFGAHS
ncbi:hypothetical protein Zmor_022854 [Zophobas morio]|uniref:Uncharacterized protein n=1 Tax=Zophobas morio TaxID=2755281 RepID=A0AA38M6R9_9CUCU|nr:hypothetical protein Zmor_022854 [Zophobas morio]